MTQIVAIEDVKIGMYLVRINTSEARLQVKSQGLIKSSSTIENLRHRGVLTIEIDETKSTHVVDKKTVDIPAADKQTQTRKPLQALTVEEQVKHLAVADKLYTQSRAIQSRFVKQLRSGDAPDFDQLSSMSQDIVDSVFENQEALSCLLMLKESNDYLVEHSLNCSILLSLFASHRGYSPSEIEDITLSGLIMDIGMSLLPKDLNQNAGEYSSSDMALMRTHVDIGFEVIQRYADLPIIVSEIVLNHHERIDGSGYPKQKTGDALPEYVQMATIVDYYDSMLTDRGYRSSTSAQTALEHLIADPGYDSSLVNSFIEAIGLYPVGSLVHLQSGKLAIVVKKNKKQSLKPVVMAFYSIRAKHHTEVKMIDLSKASDKIIGAVRPEEFELNLPKFFRTVLLNQ
jgi:HD-GYP domain-containing protein (c-di-GMP phosphodiesterase class II)